ncbi:hypothetical protein FH626_09620 [Klebsiella pneumoniae]|nr:hypothetical protein FH626_09620 [Klebsiella pneumoniae]
MKGVPQRGVRGYRRIFCWHISVRSKFIIKPEDVYSSSLGRCEQVPDMRSSYSSGAHPRGTS